MRACLLLAVALAGCSSSHGPTVPSVAPLQALRTLLDQRGSDVLDGELRFATYDSCCVPGSNCLGNNPDTPYGTYALPRRPDEAPADDFFSTWGPLSDPALTRSYRLRADEALVYIGRTPPPANYLGAHSYLVHRFEEDGSTHAVIGSLGPTVNNLTIAADRGVPSDAIWDLPFVLVTTADAAIEAQIDQTLLDAGFDPASIHHDRITHEVTRMGLDATADTFGHIWRIAVEHDPVAGQAFRDAPPGTLLRVTPRTASPAQAPHPRPVPIERGTGTDEVAWQAANDALTDAIFDHYGDLVATPADPVPSYRTAFDCIETELGCRADSPDRLALLTGHFDLDDPGDFVAVWGVNHERTGKALYSALAVIDQDHQVGFDGIDSREMVGSARYFLPDEPLVDDLFAAVIARDCASRPEPCVQVPDQCPGAPIGSLMRLTFRAYLEEATGAAPLEEELIPDQATLFTVTPP